MLASNPSSFTALSSVAMEELYALERAEALRRAEYEIRHSEALRRAEYEARHAEILTIHGRVSKSASTTPMMTPFYPPQNEDGGYFGMARERDLDYHASVPRLADDETHGPARRHGRRLSASGVRREPILPHQYPLGHAGDMRPPAHHHSHPYPNPSWSHSQVHPNHSLPHRSHLHASHEECLSPASSDSDSLLPTHSPTRAAAVPAPSTGYATDHPAVPGAYGNRTPGTDVAFTPSTSPFLGGMKKLNIHSAVPSRAPSPFHLPPPGLDSPTESHPHGHRLGYPDSPPARKLGGRKRNSTGDLVSLSGHSMPGPYPPYSSERNSAYLPTPQLSSGPSSSGSSPRSYANSLYNGAPGGPGIVGSGSLSASSSRAPSPPLWTQQQQHQKSPHHGRDHSHHHHLAHSVRAAFGMTPIHPRGRPPSGGYPSHGARPHSDGGSTPANFIPLAHGSNESAEMPAAPSMPNSRPSSPPIKLAPLKLPSSPSSPNNRPTHVVGLQGLLNKEEDVKGSMDVPTPERVELPRFSEIEAATGLR